MVAETSRRDFFRGRVTAPTPLVLRPPKADLSRFETLCTDCTLCVEACPQSILTRDTNGRAQMDVRQGECTFCGTCADICPTGALRPDAPAALPYLAQISSACLALNAISCRSCQDVCDSRAIRFQLATGGRALPQLDADLCTSCGACAAACPADAIEFSLKPQSPEEAA